MKFRKKPVVIEAWKVSELLNYAERDWKNLPGPVAAAYERGDIMFSSKAIGIHTLEGHMQADYGDMLIQGVKGEFYGCKSDIFEATYERVEP